MADVPRLATLRQTGLLDSAAEESFDRIARLAVMVLKAPVALVSLVDADRQFFKSCIGLPEPWTTTRQTPLSHSFCQHVIACREPLVINDARQHPLVQDHLAIDDLGVGSYLGTPLITADGHALGAFCVIDRKPRHWSEGEVAIVRDLAAAVTTEIELRLQVTAAKYEARQRQYAERRLRVEHAVTRALAESADLSSASAGVMDAVREAYGWHWSALWSVDKEAGVLRCADLRCVPGRVDQEAFDQMSRTTAIRRGEGLPGRVWESGKPVWIDDVQIDENFIRRTVAREARLHGAFGFPVIWDGDVVGVMEFYTDEVQPPDESLLWMLESIGRQVGQFIKRKMAEDGVRRSEARLAAVIATALDCIVAMDHRGRVIEWNPAAETTFGYGREEAVGREMADLIIPPSLREAHRAGLARYLKTGEGAVLGKRLELTGMRSNGAEFPVELTIIRITGEGEPTFTGYLRDITDRKAAQEEVERGRALFRGIAEASPDILSVYDVRTNRPVYANREINATLGYTADELIELGDAALAHFIHPQDMANIQRIIAGFDSLRDGEVAEYEYRARRKDGVYLWMSSRTVVFSRTPDGRAHHVLSLTQDVTARKHADEEREQLLERERSARLEAEQASRLKDEFLGVVSHELRTPLNAILGYAQLLQHGKMPPDVSEALEVIERNARLQSELISDLLDMSRIISGKLRLDVQRVELSEVIDAALETVRPAADAKNIKLVRTIDPLAGPISGDPSRLQQVTWNLLSNAIKFTPKGGRVQVILARVNSHIEITVSDTGQGIKPDFLPYVFEKFRQSDASASRLHGGLGLGLSIVKNLVELHGGDVRASSAGEGMGATFVVELPMTALHAEPRDDARQHPRASSVSPERHERPSLEGVVVLAVDDERDARELLRLTLQECGARVLTASCAEEALETLARERIDVLLSDIGMPQLDGYELIRRVRALPAERGGEVPAAALTAFARSEDRTRALIAGYQTHIAKPVEPLELAAAVASLARRPRGVPSQRSANQP